MASSPTSGKTKRERTPRTDARRATKAHDDRNDRVRGAWVRIGEGGRIVIPAEMRANLGIESGDKLFLELEDGTLQVRTRQAANKHMDELLKPYLPTDYSLVDELIAERRAEAARE